MKKQLSLALITVSIATLNVLPAQAANQSQASTASSAEWCAWVPWVGELCWGL